MKKQLLSFVAATIAATNMGAQKLIDLEHHFYTKEVMQILSDRKEAGIPPYYDAENGILKPCKSVSIPMLTLSNMIWDLDEKRVEAMDAAGIDMAVLSISPGLEEISEQENIPGVCRRVNDEIAAYVRQYPTRFRAAITLPVAQVDSAIQEMERCAKMSEFVYWHTHSNYYSNGHLDDDKYFPLLEKAAELGLPVYVHPNIGNEERINEFGGAMPGAGYGYAVDVMTTTLRLICKGVFDKLPNLRVFIGHFGEFYPFVLKRMTAHFSRIPGNPSPEQTIEYYLKHNICVTTSGVFDPAVYEMTKEKLGIDHIVFGSDYPYEEPKDAVKFVKSLDFKSDAERAALFEENVKAFVGADFDNLVPSQVRNVRSLSADSAHAYTLSGQPATDSSKGIIISNGVKTRK